VIRRSLIRLQWVLDVQFGLAPDRLLRGLRHLPRFLRDWLRFRRAWSGPWRLMPCLHDRSAEGGDARGEYFWQDLLIAREIHAAGPERHVDVGSRIDGFVAHVASFREIEVFDVRPVQVDVPGVVFWQADLMRRDTLPGAAGEGYCDSLSCLHALEHFGLGRYGDPLDPRGAERGFGNMASLVRPGGRFYLSVPIGRERVEFNANRVFAPGTILALAEASGLALERLIVVHGGQVMRKTATEAWLNHLAALDYSLGMFVFVKTWRS